MSSRIRSKLQERLSGFHARQEQRLARRLRLKMIAADPLPLDAPVRRHRLEEIAQ